MNPTVWGKYMWTSIHFIALGFPDNPDEKDKTNYYNFFMNLANVLPCKLCREHLSQNLTDNPLYASFLENKDTLFRWTFNLHNLVNQQLGKKQQNYDDMYNMYMNKQTLDNNMCKSKTPTINIQEEHCSSCSLTSIVLLTLLISIIFNVYCVLRITKR